VGIDPATLARSDHRYPLGSDVEGGDCQNEPESGEGTDRAQFRLLDSPAVGLVIQEIFLNIKASAVLLKGLQRRLFITHNRRKLAIDAVTSHNQMHRTIRLLLMQFDVMQAEGFAALEVKCF
jgi:hypothetical protein